MKYLIFLFCFFTLSLNAQLDTAVYKSFSDSVFRVGDKIITPKIYFDFDSGHRILETHKDSLNVVVDFLNEHPNFIVEISNYIDKHDNYNYELSKRRAKGIKAALISDFNIDESRIQTKDYGESELLIDDSVGIELVYAKKRRTEIRIIKIE